MLERALEGARRESDSSLSDADALEAVARDALLAQTRDIEASDPRRAVVLYECQRCEQTELDTGAGAIELEQPGAASLGCGATVHDLESEGRTVSRGGPLPAAVRRAVMLRDHCRCRVPGCNRRRYVDVHHLTEQAHGGEHSRRNCLVLCTTHHRLLHEGKLSAQGDADRELRFYDATGAPIGLSQGSTQPAPRSSQPPHDHARSSHDHDASSHEGLPHSATQGGASDEVREPASELTPQPTPSPAAQRVLERTSPREARLAQVAASFDLPAEPALRLLQIMGGRSRLSDDSLIESSGLVPAQFALAVTLLELAGCARRRDFTLEAV